MIYTSDHNGEFQSAIDTALISGDNVHADKIAPVTEPIVIANWTGSYYGQVSITISGDGKKSDNGKRSVIRATFNDAPVISVHKGKGVVLQGLNIQGPGIGRDSKYSPQAGIAIDPFRYNIPPDGGYTSLQQWYRGSQSTGGSTGVRVEDCTTNNTTVGVIVSPNGHTLNADCITISHHRFGTHKYGFAGCQPQEKMNVISNFQAWQNIDTLFMFNHYGAARPGHWIIDGVNIAGSVENLIHRRSGGYFPVNISNVFAESLGSIGIWNTGAGDRLTSSSINFRYPEIKGFPNGHMTGEGVTIDNTQIRYYGRKYPLLFIGRSTVPHGIVGRSMYDKNESYEIKRLYPGTVGQPVNGEASVRLWNDSRNIPVAVGDIAILMHPQSWEYKGMALINSVYEDGFTIKYASPVQGDYFGIGIYRIK